VVAFPTMSRKLDKVLREALELEQEDRAKLVGHLIESLDPEIEEGVEEAWAQEISRRAAEIDSGAATTIPWDAVRKRLGRKTGG
jgi:putative addiction module component (TIGR02574 family)